jgi:hypothetical protein
MSWPKVDAADARTVPDPGLWQVEERYRGSFEVPQLSYGTVRDLADSADHLAGLAASSFDMKNLQRAWMVKAILGNVEPGGTLVEIGAGEPLVADVLARLGYRVIVVDPYDGSGNGPREFARFRKDYPNVEIIRERFPPSASLPSGLAAVYSISVLEHVPQGVVGDVMRAARDLLAEGGLSVHAIDHVLAGWSAEEHRERLDEIVSSAGLDAGMLEEVLGRLERDPEAYFVSAEAHERWRGGLAYDDFPMRKVASIGLAVRKS